MGRMRQNQILAAALVVLCLIAAIVGGAPQGSDPSGNVSSGGSSVERRVTGPDRIAVFSLQGPISAGAPSSFFADATAPLQARLRDAADTDSVKAVLLRINSPGGTVGTSQDIYRAVMAVRDAGKPVIVTMQDVAASGGYYVASAADKIYANPGTLTGSIGVIVQGLNLRELLDKVGVEPKVYTTGEFKDLLSSYRPSTAAEDVLIQNLIDDTLNQFVADVSTGRRRLPSPTESGSSVLTPDMKSIREKLTEENVRPLADGRIFTGAQALDVGLVDALGGEEEAIADLRTLVGDEDEKLRVGDGLPDVNDLFRQFVLNAPQFLQRSDWATGLKLISPDAFSAAPAVDPSIQWLAPTLFVQS